ncbi:hypothetical protein SAMN02982996_00735 [Lonsdalea quercina]|uniref:Uncharacterized protein n=1 Tax=Lonsdalea quercina TaxID=71657 RepID=A0A1H3XR25_9GAMM|nr:hypothetical protein SAMN02982996_00735 [Lonsdalea quercina]
MGKNNKSNTAITYLQTDINLSELLIHLVTYTAPNYGLTCCHGLFIQQLIANCPSLPAQLPVTATSL